MAPAFSGQAGNPGVANGVGTNAQYESPACRGGGRQLNLLFIADEGNSAIREASAGLRNQGWVAGDISMAEGFWIPGRHQRRPRNSILLTASPLTALTIFTSQTSPAIRCARSRPKEPLGAGHHPGQIPGFAPVAAPMGPAPAPVFLSSRRRGGSGRKCVRDGFP